MPVYVKWAEAITKSNRICTALILVSYVLNISVTRKTLEFITPVTFWCPYVDGRGTVHTTGSSSNHTDCGVLRKSMSGRLLLLSVVRKGMSGRLLLLSVVRKGISGRLLLLSVVRKGISGRLLLLPILHSVCIFPSCSFVIWLSQRDSYISWYVEIIKTVTGSMEQNLPSETDNHTDSQIGMHKLKYVVVFRCNLYFFNYSVMPDVIHE